MSKWERLLSRLWLTLVPLKMVQWWALFYYRVWRRLFPFASAPQTKVGWVRQNQSFERYAMPSWDGNESFEFLGSVGHIKVGGSPWVAADKPLLWLYNLHYLDDVWAIRGPEDGVNHGALIDHWWEAHKASQGVPWDPYPTSLRAVNICKWLCLEGEEALEVDVGELLDRHYFELRRKLELHIQANHLFANLKALLFLQAALPHRRQADAEWLRKCLEKELMQQFDETGGHFELSPMYHRIMLWDLMDLYSLVCGVEDFSSLKSLIKNIAEKALTWAQAVSHPDQEVPFFNDAAIGIAPSLAALAAYARQLGLSKLTAQDGCYSGYAIVHRGNATLLCDVAEIGPAFQPGHAHADTLSFEFSLSEQRILVNSGTSEYGVSAERLRQRSTAAHNTVSLRGRNSSDVWSGFRVGRKARINSRRVFLDEQLAVIEGSHDGFARALHSRVWQLDEHSLRVADRVSADGVKTSYLHFHPDVDVSRIDQTRFALKWATGDAILELGEVVDSADLESSTWHPRFGCVVENVRLVISWTGENQSVLIQW